MSKRKTDQIARFLDVVHDLRKLCPWDRKQTHQSLAKYLIEEAYETLDAIESKDTGSLKEELGDLLLQVVLHAEIASEKKRFDFESVAKGVADKMIRRHPHVFGGKRFKNLKLHMKQWTELKAKENGNQGLLDGIPRALPGLQLAYRYGEIASSVGFDWTSVDGVLEKVEEELGELRQELKKGRGNLKKVEMELGDLLFTLSNLARHLKIDSERAVKTSTSKFYQRFTKLEKNFKKKGKSISDCSMQELDREWNRIKA